MVKYISRYKLIVNLKPAFVAAKNFKKLNVSQSNVWKQRKINYYNNKWQVKKIKSKLVKRPSISNEMHAWVIVIIKNDIHAWENRKKVRKRDPLFHQHTCRSNYWKAVSRSWYPTDFKHTPIYSDWLYFQPEDSDHVRSLDCDHTPTDTDRSWSNGSESVE